MPSFIFLRRLFCPLLRSQKNHTTYSCIPEEFIMLMMHAYEEFSFTVFLFNRQYKEDTVVILYERVQRCDDERRCMTSCRKMLNLIPVPDAVMGDDMSPLKSCVINSLAEEDPTAAFHRRDDILSRLSSATFISRSALLCL